MDECEVSGSETKRHSVVQTAIPFPFMPMYNTKLPYPCSCPIIVTIRDDSQPDLLRQGFPTMLANVTKVQ